MRLAEASTSARCSGVGGQVDLEQPRERRRPFGQLTGIALIDDARAVEHDDVIGGHRHLAPMRDQKGRAAAHHRAGAFDDLALRNRVEGRGRLVHHEHCRIRQEGAGERDALPLACRHRQSALADHRRVSLRKAVE